MSASRSVSAGDASSPRVEIRRSARRRRTVSARREGDTVVVLMPAGLTATEENGLVADLLGKLDRADARAQRRATHDDAALADRAHRLSQQWLDGRAAPVSVRWVGTMRTRWASCTPTRGTIRVSESLRAAPDYVIDYVLVHELVHLIVSGGHNARFWAEVRRYPRTERAMGYLEAYAAVLGRAGAVPEPGPADPDPLVDYGEVGGIGVTPTLDLDEIAAEACLPTDAGRCDVRG